MPCGTVADYNAENIRNGAADDNGLALTPPMGWRSWSSLGGGVTQEKMEKQMEAMVDKSRDVDGKPTSLLDLGYINCGE